MVHWNVLTFLLIKDVNRQEEYSSKLTGDQKVYNNKPFDKLNNAIDKNNNKLETVGNTQNNQRFKGKVEPMI